MDIKIEELYTLNQLKEKCSLLNNLKIDEEFYNYYFKNEINFLLKFKEKIERDFKDNINDLKFDIILNSKFHEDLKNKLILNLKKEDLYDFNNYINYIPFDLLKKSEKNKLENQFNKFKKLNDWESLVYFERIKRR